MDLYLQFREEERAGKYKGYRYPNLVEMKKHHHLYIEQFANVTEELVLAAFRGEEELTDDEISNVARYNNIHFSVLTCPKLIMLDMGRPRHKKMVGAVKGLYDQLKQMAESGNQKAGYYLEYGDWEYQDFLRVARSNRLSYIRYLGQKKELSDCILFAKPRPEKRGVKKTTDRRRGQC